MDSEKKDEAVRDIQLRLVAELATVPRGRFSVKDLARRLNISSKSVGSALTRLCQKGLVSRTPCDRCEHKLSTLYSVSRRAVELGAVATGNKGKKG